MNDEITRPGGPVREVNGKGRLRCAKVRSGVSTLREILPAFMTILGFIDRIESKYFWFGFVDLNPSVALNRSQFRMIPVGPFSSSGFGGGVRRYSSATRLHLSDQASWQWWEYPPLAQCNGWRTDPEDLCGAVSSGLALCRLWRGCRWPPSLRPPSFHRSGGFGERTPSEGIT